MKNIPDKCLKCGAPIKWDKTSNHIDCEYCGYTNLINNLGKFTISEGKKYSFFSSINSLPKAIASFPLSVSTTETTACSSFWNKEQKEKNTKNKLIFLYTYSSIKNLM